MPLIKCEQIQVPVTLGVQGDKNTLDTHFLLVKGGALYNGIVRRPFVAKLDMVVSSVYLKLKYHTEFGRPIVITTDLLEAQPITDARLFWFSCLKGR